MTTVISIVKARPNQPIGIRHCPRSAGSRELDQHYVLPLIAVDNYLSLLGRMHPLERRGRARSEQRRQSRRMTRSALMAG